MYRPNCFIQKIIVYFWGNTKMNDRYWTVGSEAEVEYKINRSVFIGHVMPVTSFEKAAEFIDGVSEKHKQATHNCSAYSIGIEPGKKVFYTDAGEPGGSAGKPILGAMLKHQVTDLALVVTRYFGGKKLGIRGLIDAYSSVAYEVISAAGLQQKVITQKFSCNCSYSNLGKIEYLLEKFRADTTLKEFSNIVFLEFEVPLSSGKQLISEMKLFVNDLKSIT